MANLRLMAAHFQTLRTRDDFDQRSSTKIELRKLPNFQIHKKKTHIKIEESPTRMTSEKTLIEATRDHGTWPSKFKHSILQLALELRQ